MGALFATDDGCAIVSVETTREASEGGFLEHSRVVATSEDGSCRWVAIELPTTADLVDWRGRLVLSDDTKRKLPDTRLSFRVDGGRRVAQIAVPELLMNDHVRVDFTRRWFVPAGFDPFAQAPEAPMAAGTSAIDVHRTMTFDLPGGDVQAAMYPGGAASAAVVEQVRIPSTPDGSTVFHAVPREAVDVSVAFEKPGDGTLRVVNGGVLATPSPATEANLEVRYTLPDPSACGEQVTEAGQNLDWDVVDPDGYVAINGPFWTLVSHGDQAVMPERASVARGLQWRFDRLALPEPALPLELKHHRRDLELVTLLRPALWRRARVADLPGDPLFPRHLYKARSSEVVTPVEAALILRLYAMQAALPADVVLVRPADQGPGDEVCPVGHDEALVRVWFDDQAYWIDPGCASCAPFEVRPLLLGASAFSETVSQTPDPVRGGLHVRVDGTRVTVTLKGPQALMLRLALEDVGPDDREVAIARRVGGSSARLVEVKGLGEAGADVTVVVDLADAGAPDFLAMGWRATDRDHFWVDAPGTWSVDRAWVDETPVDVQIGPMHYARVVTDSHVVETLDISSRTVSLVDIEALAAARRAR